MRGRDNRGLHRGSGRRLDVDRVGAALFRSTARTAS